MPSSDNWRWCKHNIVAAAFAVVGGYADVVSLKRWRCFATMTTGNTIWLGRVLGGPDATLGEVHGPLFYTAIIIAFYVGVALHFAADRRWPQRGGSYVGSVLGLVSFVCEAIMFSADRSHNEKLKWLIVLYTPLFGTVCGACADGRLGSATTMVTGHVIALGKTTANAFSRKLTDLEVRKVTLSLVVFTFSILGASAGECAWRRALHLNGDSMTNVDALFMPVPPLLVLLLWLHDHLARPRKVVKQIQAVIRKDPQVQGRPAPAGAQPQDLEAAEEMASDTSSEREDEEDEEDEDEVQEEAVERGEEGEAAEDNEGGAGSSGRRAARAPPMEHHLSTGGASGVVSV